MTMKKLLKLFESEQVVEKAVSQQQQKFMGMVHAMQKGEKVKGASAELKKVADTMGKKDAKDFASTKHKDLPKKVTEDIMLDEGGNALKHIANRFKHEFKMFMQSGDMADNLFDALYDYYNDTGEMPYGVAKARDGDPHEWVAERFYADMGSGMSESSHTSPENDPLTELARLAGLEEDGAGQFGMPGTRSTYTGNKIQPATGVDKSIEPVSQFAADLGMAPLPFFTKKEKSDYDVAKNRRAEREFQQSGSAYKDKAGTIYDRAGNPKVMPGIRAQDYFDPKPNRDRDLYRMQNTNEDLNECGDMEMDHKDSMNVSTNMSSDGTRNVTISAQGDKADELLQMLKMAGMRPHDDHKPIMVVSDNEEMMDEERETEYANTPEEEYETIDTIIHQGNDLNREKRQYADKPKLGDNPMAESALDAELDAMLESILVREAGAGGIAAEEPYRDERSGRMIYPPRGATNPPQDPVSIAPKQVKEPASILDREKPYRDPKTGRMVTPPKGLSISEPVYPAVKGKQ